MTLPCLLPKKPKRDNRLRSPAHLKWVRQHECCAKQPDANCEGSIQAAHVRTGTNGGTGLKPGDDWVISLCLRHHGIQHCFGEAKFESMYGIDMKALAQEFAAKSPALRRKRSA